MNHSADDVVRKNFDPNHMSDQMHVPDSITVGPNRSTVLRLHQDNDRVPVRMEVPDSIRLDNYANNGTANGTNHFSQSVPPELARYPSDTDVPSDDEFSAINTPRNHQPIRMADSWHIEPFTGLDEKNVLNKFQLLQNRIHHIERNLARRDFRDRVVYSCIFGYFLLQTFLSLRRSMLN